MGGWKTGSRSLVGMTVATLAAGAAARAGEPAAPDRSDPRLVVFVCEHGSAKSLVAASFFERMAKERGVALRAASRGTAPDAAVPPTVVELLRGDGFDVAAFKPQRLDAGDVRAAARVVAIGVDVGELGAQAASMERWDDVPPFAAGYPSARNVIVSHLDTLLREWTPAAEPAAAPVLDTARIEQLTGAKGKLDPSEPGVFKVSVPRSDLAVTAAGVRLTPPMGLTSWAAFKRVGDQTVVMGDTVMLEDQVNPVMSAALEAGLEVTALHNHFFWDSPKVMFMHIGGMGDEARLAAAVGKVFARIKETSGGKGDVPRAEIDPAKTTLDPAKIEAVLGAKGQLADGVYKVTIGRSTHMHGHDVATAMGVNTWAAFAGSDEQAVVDGDFAMREAELQAVLKALRGAGIAIVAIHQHMAAEEPRILFLHYWGLGRTQDLARGLKAALDQTSRDAR